MKVILYSESVLAGAAGCGLLHNRPQESSAYTARIPLRRRTAGSSAD
ncbi:hypothetical protein [Arthrobacter sp. R4-81]